MGEQDVKKTGMVEDVLFSVEKGIKISVPVIQKNV